ncbi:carbohydrate-binding module family 50 protein, partial [Piedraia hortae CBS 480.64]
SGSSSCPTAPSPLLPNTAAHCDKYYRVKAGDTCSSISSSQGITTANLNKWNPSVNSDCTNLWANYYVCVSQPKTC